MRRCGELARGRQCAANGAAGEHYSRRDLETTEIVTRGNSHAHNAFFRRLLAQMECSSQNDRNASKRLAHAFTRLGEAAQE